MKNTEKAVLSFKQKLETAQQKNDSLLCVGLDAAYDQLPYEFLEKKYPQYSFNRHIIEQTFATVCAFKPNSAFYEARGHQGIEELFLTCQFIRKNYPTIPIILDCKRGDIGHTNRAYAQFAFEYLQVDAVTLQPYQGLNALNPFFEYQQKGKIILCRTSNPGAVEFQDLEVKTSEDNNSAKSHNVFQSNPLWYQVAKAVVKHNENDDCLLVVGATYPEEMARLRQLAPTMPLLVPGVGRQGGDLEQVINVGLDSEKKGLILNSSRGIIFADDPSQAANKLKNDINTFRNR